MDELTGTMRLIPAATFAMGSEHFYPEEAPVRTVRVDAFWLDETPVTNAQFASFVAETGYVSMAETPPDPADYSHLSPGMGKAGSAVFRSTSGPVDLSSPEQWWEYCFGANWKQPLGPDSSLGGLEDHPVVHIAYPDAEAFARWARKSLPTEAEWELAARGGLDRADFAWGNELAPGGQSMANYWHGLFPFANQAPDGWTRTSPVRSYPPNGYGLYDMVGNVWEWTSDWYAMPKPGQKAVARCCVPANPRGGTRAQSFDPAALERIPRKVLKGGSHLCAANYCQRYRPAARHPETIDTSTSHIGFRCVRRAGEAPKPAQRLG